MKLTRKKLPIVLVCLGAIAGGTFLVGYVYYVSDSAAPYDDDLEYVYTPIDDHENGLVQVPLAPEDVFWPLEPEDVENLIDEMLRGEAWDRDLAKDILTRNEEAFGAFEDVLKYPRLQYPNTSFASDADEIPESRQWVRLSRAVLIRCESLFRAGNKRDALDGVLDVVTLGRRIQGADGAPLCWVAGHGIRRTGLDVFDRMLPEVDLSPQELESYAARLSGLGTDQMAVVNVIKQYYRVAKATHVQVLRTVASSGRRRTAEPFLNLNATLTLFADYCRDLLKVADEARKHWPERPRIRRPYVLGSIPAKNAVGITLFQSVAQRLHDDSLWFFWDEWVIAKSRLLVALKRFRLLTGELPESLGELVPDHISEVPLDPFDGKPMRYSRSKRIFYSVFVDFVDQGGSKRDLVFKIPF